MPLGFAWLQRLIWEGDTTRRWRGKLGDEEGTRRLARLLETLASALPPHSAPEEWVASEEEVWRLQRALAVFLVARLGDGGARESPGALIERIARASTVGMTGVLNGLGDSWSIGRRILGATISGIPDPGGWFEAAWRRLMPARDRMRHWRFEHPIRDENPPLLLGVWGLYGLSCMQPASDPARRLWLVLERAVREGLLTDPSFRVDRGWQAAHRFLGAIWAHTFPEDPPADTPGSLDSFVAPFIRPETSFAELFLTLRANGVSVERLATAAGNAERARRLLSLVADDILDQYPIVGHDHQPHSPLEVRVRELAREIGLLQA